MTKVSESGDTRAGRGTAWRSENIGRLLLSATSAFVQDKLRPVHAAGFGLLTEAHMALVQNLDDAGTRLTTLAARAGMTKQSMLELVNKVEALGLIERRADESDRRAKTIAFTQGALPVQERLRAGVETAERRLALVTGQVFVDEMKVRFAGYISEVGTPGTTPTVSEANGAGLVGNAGRHLAAANRVFAADVLRGLHKNGFEEITAGHQIVLRNLGFPGSRLTEMATRAQVTKQTMAELVDKMEDAGFIKRLAAREDRRAKAVVFTPAGLDLLEQVRIEIRRAERRMTAVTGPLFVATLRRQLTAYRAAAAAPSSTDAPPL